jgi:hypothetical protein
MSLHHRDYQSLLDDGAELNTAEEFFSFNAENIDDIESVSAPNDFKDDYIGKFPWIHDNTTFAEYKLHERAFYDIYQCIIPNTLLLMKILYDLSSMPDDFYFILAFFFVFVSLILYIAFLSIKMQCGKNAIRNSNSFFSKVARRFQLTWVGQNIENILTICGTILHGFILYGRVCNGQCSSLSLWESQVLDKLIASLF